MYKQQIKSQIANYLGIQPHQVTLFWKGRVGLFAILDALDIKALDEVILPAYTCVVVPNAIIYKKAIPVYADINAETFNIDVSDIEQKITSRTKLIIAQNTYGLSSDIDELQKIAQKHNLHLIEDCTHGFAGTYKSKQNGTIASASFFSSQWNKTFSTGIGGFVVANDEQLVSKLNEFESKMEKPSIIETRLLHSQIAIKNRLPEFAYWSAVKTYRKLNSIKLIPGSSSNDELISPIMPDGYLKGMSEMQAKTGIGEIKKIKSNLDHRREIAKMYDRAIMEMGGTQLFQPTYANHTFIKYPLLVKNRTTFMEKAVIDQIPLNDWFLSPIHPITKDFEKWNYNMGSNPTAEYISNHVVNLLTEISIEKATKTIQFLRKNQSEIIFE